MPLPDADRLALEQRLVAIAPTAVAALDAIVDDDEELRDALSTAKGGVVIVTSQRALFVPGPRRKVMAFGLDAVDITRRDSGLGVDAEVVDDRLVLAVPRGTVDRLGAVTTDTAPARATWLPVAAPPASDPLASATEAVAPPVPKPARPVVAPAPPPPRPAGGRVAVPAGPWVPDAGWTQSPPTGSPTPGPTPPSRGAVPPPPPPQPPVAAATRVPPPGWHPDPSQRHWWRWWDGLDWTDHVADGGGAFTDPLPPRGQAPAGR